MLAHLHELPILNCNYLFSYIPLVQKGELEMHYFEETVIAQNASCIVCYPLVDIGLNIMSAVATNTQTKYEKNKWGISEPQNGTKIDNNLIDVVFVPLLIFDKAGNRVGYGKGFYDKFLATCNKNCTTIGFSLFEPIDQIVNTNEFDVPLKYCITPAHLYEF
jgi:5-formyltetrahydrofolate cyclo-ligase